MKPWLVAHRGAPTEAQENTLHAFEAAKKYPIGYIEFDVRVTADDMAVIHHDAAVGGLVIAENSFSDLKKLEPNLARFEDVVKHNGHLPLMVELKGAGAAKHVAPYLKAHPKSFATSFMANELEQLGQLGINKKRMFLAQHNHPFGLIKQAEQYGYGGVTVNKWYATPNFLRNAQKLRLDVFIYTVNSRHWTRLIRHFQPGALICTDRPDKLGVLR